MVTPRPVSHSPFTIPCPLSSPLYPPRVLPSLHAFSQADEEFARQCLDQYKGTLRGPPNHRTQEQGGLLRTALDFLREQGGNDVDREGGDAEHPPDAVESDGDSGGRGGSSSGGSSADEHDDDDESSDDGGGVRSD